MLREPRPLGFPLLFTANLLLIEPAVAFLHEHFVQRAHTADTLRTYCEILYDWFETLEQNAVDWASADAVDLVAYRNRMLLQPSARTGRPPPVRSRPTCRRCPLERPAPRAQISPLLPEPTVVPHDRTLNTQTRVIDMPIRR